MLKICVSILCFIVFSFAESYANNIYLDINGNYTDAGDAEKNQGFGLAIGMDILEDLAFYARIIRGSVTKDKNDVNETEYVHAMYMGVIQYKYPVSRYPIYATGAVGIGYTNTSIDPKNYDNNVTDSGPGVAVWAGLKYDLAQWVSPFMEIGFHQSYYEGDLKDENIYGYQLIVGIRFTVYGQNKPLYSDY